MNREPLPGVRCLLPAILVATAALTARAEPPQALPVDGEPFDAELEAIDAQWQITFTAGKDRRVVPAADLVAWGNWAEVRRGPILVLADGGLLVAAVYQTDSQKLTVDSDLFGLVKLPLEGLAGIVFQPPADRHALDLLLDELASATGDSDRVILANGDRVAGRLETIKDDTLTLETAVGPVDIEFHRARALIFNPALVARARQQDLRAVAGFRDGSRLVAKQLVAGGESLEITTADGLVWTTTLKTLVAILPQGGRVTYLSDLQAAGYRHVPFLELTWPYRTDRNVTGGRLRCDGRLYLKGLGIHSAARLTYLLDEPYRRFQAELAVDDHTAGRGSVRFRVFLDGRQKYASGILRGGQPPLPVSIDLDGAKRLDLIVDYADRADERDHADWLNARLVQ